MADGGHRCVVGRAGSSDARYHLRQEWRQQEPFVCTRCAHRQDDDARCCRCGWDVHDLRSSRTRDFLAQIEAQHRERCEGRIRAAAVLGGIGLVVAAWFIPGYWRLRGAAYPGLPLLADQVAFMLVIAVVADRIGVAKLVRPRFPFLPGLPPADRP
jgi:hypothetical protein